MKHVPQAKAQKFSNSATCHGWEYDLEDQDINGAVGIVDGRYPEHGFVVNEACKELVYVISGSGRLTTDATTVGLSSGDVALIPAGERYYFEGVKLKIFMPCTPAWYPAQHKELAS